SKGPSRGQGCASEPRRAGLVLDQPEGSYYQTPNIKHQRNTKHQAPNTKEDPNSKPQTEHDPARRNHATTGPHLSLGFGLSLELFGCLVVAVWCFTVRGFISPIRTPGIFSRILRSRRFPARAGPAL